MMDDRRDDRAILTLAACWDRLAHGREAAAVDVDPALAAGLRLLHALDDAPGADPAFKARLLARLEEQRAPMLHLPASPLVPLPPV